MTGLIADSINVLAINSGSSSTKFGLYDVNVSTAKELFIDTLTSSSAQAMFERLNAHLAAPDSAPNTRLPSVIGHRLVHGGPTLRQHCVIDDSILRRLEEAVAFAPLHMRCALALIDAARQRFPGVPQVACFDTTFHVDLPDVARVLPIAKELRLEGIQRYGFHGLSCESIVYQLRHEAPSGLPVRLIIAHLGNGVSVTAVKNGKSIDTSMGLTPTGGVIMGTRSGDLDPGVLLYLLREMNFDAALLEELVNYRSGLLGISGISSDMRDLHEAVASSLNSSELNAAELPTSKVKLANADAHLAIQMFCYSLRKQIAAMIAVLGGIDMIVFTGGIGENADHVRAKICDGLAWIGISLDQLRNRAGRSPINDRASKCAVLILGSKEEIQIARHAYKLGATEGV